MDLYTLSDNAIEDELGRRVRELRLRRNLTQQALAEATTLSLNTIKALESGKGKISTVIAVLRELRALEHLDNFIPEPGISPLQLAKRHGKPRQRASGERAQQGKTAEDSEW